ncbi:MAG: glycosyltransferase 4 family protein [Candidatus Woesearchaeota archaeon]
MADYIISYPVLIFCFLVSFLFVLLLIPKWITRMKKLGFVGKDMQKVSKEEVAELGGVVVFAGFLLGSLLYIAIDTFYILHDSTSSFLLRDLTAMAGLLTISLIAVIGFVDDILGWKIGLGQWKKPLLCAVAALPMMVVNSGHSTMMFPLIGMIDLGLVYPLFLVPLAITVTSNGFNMLAGYNGLEAGLGVIILSALAYVSWVNDAGHVAILALCMVFALLGFLVFNSYPSRVFPGNTMTYAIGATIGVVAILGNVEKFAVLLFLPFIVQFFLKARGRMKKESFAKVKYDGSLEQPYSKIYGLEHAMIMVVGAVKKKVFERDVVYSLYILELALVAVMFVWRTL